MNKDKGYHSELLCKLYGNKFLTREYLSCKEAVKILLNEGYITKIRKKKDKYYLSDISKAIQTLVSHGYITPDGRSVWSQRRYKTLLSHVITKVITMRYVRIVAAVECLNETIDQNPDM